MANPNPNDGTQVATGEVISNESIELVGGAKGDPALPTTNYKLPRSKIAVGPYGQDWGDAQVGRPLQVESLIERQTAELEHVRGAFASQQAQSRYSAEAYTTDNDRRGQAFSTRGVR